MSAANLRSKECSLHNQWDSPLLVVAVMASLSHSRSECQLSAIKQLESDLINVIKHEIDEVLVQAWSVDIIGEQVRSLAQSSHTGRVKAEKFIAVIRDRLKTDPGTFDTFLQILKSTPSLKYLAEALEKKLCNQHRTKDDLGGVPSHPSMSSTPKSSANSQPRGRYGVSSASKANSSEEYHTRTPPRGRKKRRNSSSDSPVHHGSLSSDGQPKLETRDDTDEESGFQEELNSTNVAAVNTEQLNKSEKVDGDTYASASSRPDEGHISFKAPIEAQSDYIIAFSKTTGDEPDVEAKSQTAEPDNDVAAAGVVGQELQHDATSQQQVVSGHGIQTTAEGWADKAAFHADKTTFYMKEGAAREAEMANEIEELKVKIASLKQQVDANKNECQRVEQVEEHMKAELDECKEMLATKEEELKQLNNKREAEIQAAEENLKNILLINGCYSP